MPEHSPADFPTSRLFRDYAADVRAASGGAASWHRFLWLPICTPGLRALLCYRLARLLAGRSVLHHFAAILKRLGQLSSGAEIHPMARLAAGLRLPHPTGVVIGPGVRVHEDCVIFQQVTLGPRRADASIEDTPCIEAQSYIYAGAKVLGPIRVGSRTQIGPNCVVFRDLAPGSTVLPPEPKVLEGLSFSLRTRESAGQATVGVGS